MISLPVLPKKRVRNGPKMPRYKLLDLCERALAAPTLEEAGLIVRKAARPIVETTDGTGATWKRMLRRLAKGLVRGKSIFPIISLKGNVKLPFACFSALPRFTCPGAGECLGWCYSFTSWRNAGPFCRQLQNTLLLKHKPGMVRDAFFALPEGHIFRLYVDGDFDSRQTVDMWMNALARRPDVRCYGYSKSWDLLKDRFERSGIPENYLLNLSSGGANQKTSKEEMLKLPFVRGEFITLPIDYHPRKAGKVGYERYDDPDYHRAVRAAASERDIRVFSCPGKCGECAGGRHACSDRRFKGIAIAIGQH